MVPIIAEMTKEEMFVGLEVWGMYQSQAGWWMAIQIQYKVYSFIDKPLYWIQHIKKVSATEALTNNT